MEMTLREEDLVPGKPFLHPETKLEYADFAAWFCGKDPIPHWRNAQIKRVHEQAHRGEIRWAAQHIETYIRRYDRDGNSYTGPKYLASDPLGGPGTIPYVSIY